MATNQGAARGSDDARAFLHDIPVRQSIPPGHVLHTTVKNYVRFGPKANIISSNSTGYDTENYLSDSWLEFGPNYTITHSLYQDRNADGDVYQESWQKPDESQYTDLRTSQTQKGSGGVMQASDTKTLVSMLIAALDSGQAKAVGQTATTLTLEGFTRDLSQQSFVSADSYSVPYYADLNPMRMTAELTIRDDGTIISRKFYVKTQDGNQLLVQSEETTTQIINGLPKPLTGGPLDD
jgi:hypothetical protein